MLCLTLSTSTLVYHGYKVVCAEFTNVDDKIIRKAKEGESVLWTSQKYIKYLKMNDERDPRRCPS